MPQISRCQIGTCVREDTLRDIRPPGKISVQVTKLTYVNSGIPEAGRGQSFWSSCLSP